MCGTNLELYRGKSFTEMLKSPQAVEEWPVRRPGWSVGPRRRRCGVGGGFVYVFRRIIFWGVGFVYSRVTICPVFRLISKSRRRPAPAACGRCRGPSGGGRLQRGQGRRSTGIGPGFTGPIPEITGLSPVSTPTVRRARTFGPRRICLTTNNKGVIL